MRNFHKKAFSGDKKFALAFIITLICAIICGIVLYKPVLNNIYFKDFADNYIYYVFNFKNSRLLFTHLLSDLVYLYIIFFICYFTKFKYITLILIFLRGLFFGVYAAILFGASAFGGTIAAIFVFVPVTVISLIMCYIVADFCNVILKKYVLFMPLALSLINLIVHALLINVLFRIIIVIV